MKIRTVILAIVLVAASGSPLLAQRYTLQGRDVAVYNLVGTITVTGSGGGDVLVDVTARGRDAAMLRIEPGRVGGSDALRIFADSDRILYPGMRSGSRSSLPVNRDGTFLSGSGGVIDRIRSRNVTIAGSGSGDEAYADVAVALPPGRTLRLLAAVGSIEVRNVEGTIHVSTSAARSELEGVRGSVDVRTSSGGGVLSGIDGSLSVRSSSGSVRASNVRGGSHEIRASSGSIEARDVTGSAVRLAASSGSITAARIAAGETELRASSGSIRVDGVSGDRFSARTSSGRIVARNVGAAEIELGASSGSVDLAAPGPLRSLAVSTSSGSVRAAIPAGFGGSVDIRTSSGGIRSELPVVMQSMSRSQLTGQIGVGSGALRIRTSSGSVQLTAN